MLQICKELQKCAYYKNFKNNSQRWNEKEQALIPMIKYFTYVRWMFDRKKVIGKIITNFSRIQMKLFFFKNNISTFYFASVIAIYDLNFNFKLYHDSIHLRQELGIYNSNRISNANQLTGFDTRRALSQKRLTLKRLRGTNLTTLCGFSKNLSSKFYHK